MKSSEEQALFPNALRAIPAEKDGAGPEDPVPGAQAASEAYRRLLGGIPVGVGIVHRKDGGLCLDYANDALLRIHRIAAEKAACLPDFCLTERICEPDRAAVDAAFDDVDRNESGEGDLLYRVAGDDGCPHWVSMRVRRGETDHGVRCYYISVTSADEHKRAEQELLKSRQMYDDAAQAARLVIWTYDPDGHRAIFLHGGYTGEVCKKYGLPEILENVPDSLLDFVDERDREAFLGIYRAIDGGEPEAVCEFRYQLPAQTAQQYERMTFRRIEDQNGSLLTVHCCGQNITLLRQEEEKYALARRQLDSAYPHALGSFHLNLTKNWCGDGKSPLPFVLKQQASGTVDGYFAEFAKLIADENVKRDFFRRFDRKLLLEQFAKGVEKVSVEYPIVYEDGSRHWRDGLLFMLKNPTTGDVEAVTYAVDIDRQKRKDEIISRLVSEGCDYIGVIDTTDRSFVLHDGYWEHDDVPEGRVFGYTEVRELVAPKYLTPEDGRVLIEKTEIPVIAAALRESPQYSVSYKCHMYGKGPQLVKQIRFSWLNEDHREILAIQTDVTEVYEREQQHLRQVEDALSEANRASESKSMFLSSMSHDLRTPLNGVIGFTKLAIKETDAEKKQDYLEKIESSGELLLDLVNDTLELSRIESGKYTLALETLDLRRLVENTVTALRPSAEIKSIRLETELTALPPGSVRADKLKVQKILLNLLSNAIKFTPSGGSVRLTAARLAEPENGCNYRFTIEDTGVGISPEFIPDLFEPFSQEHRQSNVSTMGTGLGLSIVKRIVDLMGGGIRVQSKLGKGSRFTVELPLESAAPGAQDAAEPAAETSLKGRTVLLCEDNYLNTEIATILLKEQDVLVDCAANGAEGVRMFGDSLGGYYDAVLMDLRMPVMDGCSAARAIRALDRPDAKTVPIIAMTADAFEESIQAAQEAGMNGYVTKPVIPEKLFAALRTAFDG